MKTEKRRIELKLHTQRLKITPCTDESLSTYVTDPYEFGPHIHRHLEKLREDPSLLGWGVWLVINKENNTIIGDIGFKGKPTREHTVEVGYGIAASSQDNGFATEAVQEIIKWAFSFDDVQKVVAECMIDNHASIRVLEKLNMSKIGTKNDMILWELNKQ